MIGQFADPFQPRYNGHRGRLVRWVGHELVELDSPQLRVIVSPTRGAEILEIRAKSHDLDLLWHGHPDVVSNRGGRMSTTLGKGNFLDDFAGGWQEILPSAQFPVEYRGALLGQHGEAALLPWSWRVIEDEPARIVIEFSVELRRLPLRLVRRMTVQDERLRFDEVVENLGRTPIAVQWGHHIALGGPIIGAGARWSLPRDAPFAVQDEGPGSRLAAGTGRWPVASDSGGEPIDLATLPTDNGTHQTVILGPLDVGRAELDNDDLGLRIRVDWDPAVYRYCWMWTVAGGLPDWPFWGRQRLATIEPFTSPLVPLDQCVDRGEALSLAAGERRASWTEFSVTTLERNAR